MDEIATELESIAGEAPQHPGPKAGAKAVLAGLTATSLHPNFRKLRSAVSHHRVIILKRGAVVAVTSVVSLGVALFLHALFAGLFVWSAVFPWAHTHGDGKTVVGDPDSGGAPISLPASLDDGHNIPAATPASALASVTPAAPALPAFPSLPDLPAQARAADLSAPPALPAMPASDPLGAVKVAAPPTLANLAPAATSTVGASANNANAVARGPGVADVAHGGFADEPVFSLSKEDGSGIGHGKGNGFGNGIDRGLSAADRSPQLLDARAGDDIQLPLKYQLNPPEKGCHLVLTILPDGTVGDIAMQQSCGVDEIDKLVFDYARTRLRFSPAYHDGKAITAPAEWGLDFRPYN